MSREGDDESAWVRRGLNTGPEDTGAFPPVDPEETRAPSSRPPMSAPKSPASPGLVGGGALLLIAVVLTLVGAVWSLQGLGVITGSPMTGQGLWLGIGLVLVVAGPLAGAAGARLLRRR